MTRHCNPIAPKSNQTLQGSCQPCPCEAAVRSSRATSDPDPASAVDNLRCWLAETIASRVLSYAANQEPPEPANPLAHHVQGDDPLHRPPVPSPPRRPFSLAPGEKVAARPDEGACDVSSISTTDCRSTIRSSTLVKSLISSINAIPAGIGFRPEASLRM